MTACALLPVPPLPRTTGTPRPVVLAHGAHGAEIPRHVAENIGDIRWPGEDGLEGFRLRDRQWVDLLAFGARRLAPPDMDDLGAVD